MKLDIHHLHGIIQDMNITPSTKEKIETPVDNYLIAGDRAKSLGFDSAAAPLLGV